MKAKTTDPGVADDRHERRVVHELEGGAAGAATGAIVGVAAGPVGAVVGAVLGAAAGAAAGFVVDADEEAQSQRTRELDADIGVSGGTLGAPNLAHPEAKRGTYSAASSGASEASASPAEGGMQTPEE